MYLGLLKFEGFLQSPKFSNQMLERSKTASKKLLNGGMTHSSVDVGISPSKLEYPCKDSPSEHPLFSSTFMTSFWLSSPPSSTNIQFLFLTPSLFSSFFFFSKGHFFKWSSNSPRLFVQSQPFSLWGQKTS